MNFFKSKTRTPGELVRSVREAIQRLDAAGTGPEGKRKVSFSLCLLLVFLSLCLCLWGGA